MITKFKIFESDNINSAMPFFAGSKDLHDIVPPYFIGDDSIDLEGLDKRLRRLFNNNWCIFKGKDHKDYKEEFLNLSGIVKNSWGTYYYDPQYDLEIIFEMEDGMQYEVDHESLIFVYTKEEKKIKIVDKNIDPYGEEDWEDDIEEEIKDRWEQLRDFENKPF
jgi:hypothetical protein